MLPKSILSNCVMFQTAQAGDMLSFGGKDTQGMKKLARMMAAKTMVNKRDFIIIVSHLHTITQSRGRDRVNPRALPGPLLLARRAWRC